MNLHNRSANRLTNWNEIFRYSILLLLPGVFGIAGIAGCGTTTNRIATEQLLLSDAVDRAVGKIDFSSLGGKSVFLDTIYLRSVKGVGFVNSEYVISSLRQQLTAARCPIQDNREDAEIVVEARIGALGTDGHEVVYGIPQSGTLSVAAKVLSNSPVPAIPEISVGKNNAQSGIAKIIVFAYDRESREPVWQSGIAKAESTSKDTWFLGAGPFQEGSIYEGMRFAGKKLKPKSASNSPTPSATIPFQNAYTFPELPRDSQPSPQLPPASRPKSNPVEPDTIGTASFDEPVADDSNE
jgi:hypothetical protein